VSRGYIHGTDLSEQHRLAELNRLSNRPFIDFLRSASEARVLEVGSGLGILANGLADVSAGIHVTGLERSRAQLQASVPHPRVCYVQGDALALPFASGFWNIVYAC